MKYKYIVLDFGKVIAGPTTGHWDFTPKFKELIDFDLFDIEKFSEIRKEYAPILSEKVNTLDEEYNMFYRFYDGILSKMNYPKYDKSIIKQIAYDRTYSNDKYTLYDNIIQELEELNKKYILIMLTDNWPSVIDYLKNYNLYDYFDKVYVSSIFGVEKNNKRFFKYVIDDYNIKKGEALFIDDSDYNLDNAYEMGFDVLLMNRNNDIVESKYRIINSLLNI